MAGLQPHLMVLPGQQLIIQVVLEIVWEEEVIVGLHGIIINMLSLPVTKAINGDQALPLMASTGQAVETYFTARTVTWCLCVICRKNKNLFLNKFLIIYLSFLSYNSSNRLLDC
jgi:hypothetical protein